MQLVSDMDTFVCSFGNSCVYCFDGARLAGAVREAGKDSVLRCGFVWLSSLHVH